MLFFLDSLASHLQELFYIYLQILVSLYYRLHAKYYQQECIPVGCVPFAAVAVSRGGVCSVGCLLMGVSASGGCLLMEGVCSGGVCSWGVSASRGVSRGDICSQGVCLFRGMSAPRGVSAPRGFLLPWECLSPRGVCSQGCGIPPCTEADTPSHHPPCGQTDRL